MKRLALALAALLLVTKSEVFGWFLLLILVLIGCIGFFKILGEVD